MYRTWPTLVAAAQAVAGDPEELIDAVLNQIANAALAALAIEDPTLLGDPAYEIEDLPDPDLGEQDDRGTKQRYDPLRGFGNFAAAARVCRAYDEQRDDWRARRKPKQTGSLAEQRPFFRQGCAARQNRRIPP